LRLEISDLEEQRDAYRAVIGQDSTMLERLKYDEYLEEFARERYYMQGKGEQIFVFEEEQK
jgi:cell division protein FtsB